MKRLICMLIIASHLSACTTYVNRSVPFRQPEEYANFQNVSGLMVGGEAFTDTRRAEETFGFDIRSTGVLPVQIVIDNRSEQGIEIVPGQTFLVDMSNGCWKILSNGEAVERVDKGTQGGAIAGGAGKGVVSSAAAGTLLGLAIGVVSGHGAGDAAVKGGASGGDDDRGRGNRIAEDSREKGIDGTVIPAGSMASGFIYFPGEAPRVHELRLQVRFCDSGTIETLSLKLR